MHLIIVGLSFMSQQSLFMSQQSLLESLNFSSYDMVIGFSSYDIYDMVMVSVTRIISDFFIIVTLLF